MSAHLFPQERDEWVSAIEQQILSSLQSNESNKSKVSLSLNSIHKLIHSVGWIKVIQKLASLLCEYQF